MMNVSLLSVAIFLLTYAFIITEKWNRAVIALFGASLMILLGVLDVHQALSRYIEWNTITLLIGMMILVSITSRTGVFQYIAIQSTKIAQGNPIWILVILFLFTGVASALLDNVTTVLLIVPITFSITRILQVNPVPYLISEIISSNIGGTATLIGDPPNIMIGSANAHLTFNTFLFHLGPVTAAVLAVTLLLLYFIYRNQLKVDPQRREALLALNGKEAIQDPVLMKKSLIILGLTIFGFTLHSMFQMQASIIAMTGATFLMMIGLKEREVEEIFNSIEWGTLFFFVALFVLVGGLQEVGIMKGLAQQMIQITDGNIPLTSGLILWGSGIASATIDNIPMVATMIPLIQELAAAAHLAVNSPEVDVLWWSLALGACLGGNGTLLGASANIIVAGLATHEKNGFSYWEFLKVGAPLTLVSLILSHIYLYLRYWIYLSP
jgi:Na+/H+ antiporter NhaD/arsenite permease-like protein